MAKKRLPSGIEPVESTEDTLDTTQLQEALKRRREKLGASKLGDFPDPLVGGMPGGK